MIWRLKKSKLWKIILCFLVGAGMVFVAVCLFSIWMPQGSGEGDSKLKEGESEYIQLNNAKWFVYHNGFEDRQLQGHENVGSESVSRWIKQGCFMNPLTEYKFSKMNSLKIARTIEEDCASVSTSSCPDIPKVVYFILGPKFKLHHYLAIKSVFDLWKPFAIYLVSDTIFPISDPLFLKMIKQVKPGLMKSRDATAVFGSKISEKEHKADVVRLELLIAHGGIYVDTDVFAFKSIDDLVFNASHSSVMGKEDTRGLNNGIILSKRCSPFLLNWYRQYQTFNRYKWNDHSIKLPLALYKENKRDLLVTDAFDVSWNNNTAFFRPAEEKRYAEKYYCKHLFIRGTPQEHLKWNDLQNEDSDYGRICRAIMNGSQMP